MLAVFIIKYWRKGTTAISFLVVSIILFGLLMAQVALVIFSQIYLPVGLAALAVILAALPYPMAAWYRKISSNSSNSSNSSSGQGTQLQSEIRKQIAEGELDNALVMLKRCEYSDELLEVGYELGVLLEAGKNWAGASDLYNWLSQFNPGMDDFVTRIEEIRRLHERGRKTIKEDETLHIVGHYELRKKIAWGASASVYEAYDMRTQNRVALKVMLPDKKTKTERDRIDPWLHEAQIISQL